MTTSRSAVRTSILGLMSPLLDLDIDLESLRQTPQQPHSQRQTYHSIQSALSRLNTRGGRTDERGHRTMRNRGREFDEHMRTTTILHGDLRG